MRKIIALCVVVLLTGITASAQPLADRVPADALVYFGWRGVDDPGPGYSDSHFKAILDQSNIPAVFNETLPQVIRVIEQKDPKAKEAFDVMGALVPALWHKPTAFFFSGLNFNNGNPQPKIGIICKAGDQAAAMAKTIGDLLAKAPPPDIAVRVFQSGDCLVFAIGFDQADPVVADAAAGAKSVAAIKSSREFSNAISQVLPDPTFIMYVDVEKMLLQVNQIVEMIPDPQPKALWPKIRDAIGLPGLKRVIATSGFEGHDWVTQEFVEAPEPRSGMLSMMDAKPLDDAMLKIVPQDAAMVFGGSFDVAKLVDTIHTIVGNIDPNAQQMMDQGMGAVSLTIGKNLQKDVLEPLGDHWIAYSSPTVAGAGFLGVVVANKLDDPAKAQTGLTQTFFAVNSAIQMAMKDEKDVKLYGRSTKVGDQTIYYMGTPFITPSWSIKDGYLYLGLYPQTTVSAARHTAAGGKSILDNPGYQAMRKRLGAEKVTGIKYVDISQSIGSGYQGALAVSRLGLGLADMIGVKSPELVLPPLDVILPHIAPAGGVTWVDAAGVHSKSVSPFPGADVLGGDLTGLAAAAPLMLGIAMPATVRARQQAVTVASMSNLRQIGVGLMVYSQQHQDTFPDNLGQLVSAGILPDVTIFVTPERREMIPQNIANGSPDEKAQWVNDNSDYVYLGTGKKMADMKTPWAVVICHEREELAKGPHVSTLFADGHCENLTREELQDRLNK